MSLSLPSGLTPDQIIQGLAELADEGLDALDLSSLTSLVNAASKIAQDGAALLSSQATPAEVLQTEVDTEQGAADVAEHEKFPNG